MCYVNNTVGNVQRIFQILVQFAPEFVDDKRTEHRHSVKLHHGLNLDCRADANPEPTIKWTFVSDTSFGSIEIDLTALDLS
jgi:hypothetical protein